MGMDIYGLKPKSTEGDYFRANLWGWRPIHFLCDRAIELSCLKIDTVGWGHNGGYGLKTQEECDKLADALLAYVAISMPDADDDERFYLCLGMWVSNSGQFLNEWTTAKLNDTYKIGRAMKAGVVQANGDIVEPAHSICKADVNEFVSFLRNCGGFEIW